MATSLLLAVVSPAVAQMPGVPKPANIRPVVITPIKQASATNSPAPTTTSPATATTAPTRTTWEPFPPAPPVRATGAKSAILPVGYNANGTRTVNFQKTKEEEEQEMADLDPKRFDDTSKPNPGRVFRMDSNMSLDVRMADELYADDLARYNEELSKNPKLDKKKPSREQYRLPESRPAGYATGPYVAKTGTYAPSQVKLEPGYVVHRRLFFEEKNAERYGWDLGLLSPLVSTAYFYKDIMLFPSMLASNWRERYDTNAGQCQPGSPVPYFLYPPEITLAGGTFGAAAIVGVALLLP